MRKIWTYAGAAEGLDKLERSYEKLPLQVNALWFWWYPDPTFAALQPTRLFEPRTDEDERRDGLYRTGASAVTIRNFWWYKLSLDAPAVHFLLSQVRFTTRDVDSMMLDALGLLAL